MKWKGDKIGNLFDYACYQQVYDSERTLHVTARSAPDVTQKCEKIFWANGGGV